MRVTNQSNAMSVQTREEWMMQMTTLLRTPKLFLAGTLLAATTLVGCSNSSTNTTPATSVDPAYPGANSFNAPPPYDPARPNTSLAPQTTPAYRTVEPRAVEPAPRTVERTTVYTEPAPRKRSAAKQALIIGGSAAAGAGIG